MAEVLRLYSVTNMLIWRLLVDFRASYLRMPSSMVCEVRVCHFGVQPSPAVGA
jgi:hypothetical protein